MNKIVLRNILLAILLIIFLVVVIVAKGKSPFGKKESQFAVGPSREITRIEFSQGSKNLLLQKQKEGWTVNGKHEARKSGISFIMHILNEIKIKSPLSPDLFKSEIKEKNIDPVKVRVFEKNRLLRTFLVYKTGTNKYGNIMQKRVGSKPFIVYIPGFEGDIGSAFTLNELFWEPYTIFNLLPSEISEISLENIADPSSSFSIINKRNKYTLSDNGNLLTGWDTAQVKRYISYFTWIPFERWALELSKTESDKIKSGEPLCRLKVKKTDGGEINLTLWERTIGDSAKTDSDRLWAKTGDKEGLFVIRYFDIDPLLKKRSYFFAQ